MKSRRREGPTEALDFSHVENDQNEAIAPSPLKLLITLSVRCLSGQAAIQANLDKPPKRLQDDDDCVTERRRCRRKDYSPTSQHYKLDAEGTEWNGHPSARGCWPCLRLNIRCNILDDEHAWPCHSCKGDEEECDLIQPPAFKQACNGCRNRREACSFTYTSDHEGPCESCSRDGSRCIAGPVMDTILCRARYDWDWAKYPLQAPKVFKPRAKPQPRIKPPPKIKPLSDENEAQLISKELQNRTGWTCSQCRRTNRVCSLSVVQGDACNACKIGGNFCLPEQIEGEANQQHTALPTPPASTRKRKETRELQPQQHSGYNPMKRSKPSKSAEQGVIKTIQTAFCHPISFNVDDTVELCNFCDGSAYAFNGLGPKEVEVIAWSDGRGFTEISGGHLAEDRMPTSMCMPCTMARMRIVECGRHVMHSISSGVTREDYTVALSALFDGKVREQDIWCSLCFGPATHECDSAGCDVRGKPLHKCGLELCDQCTGEMKDLHDGDLQKMLGGLSVLDDSFETRPLGIRADQEFLRWNGVMVQHVHGAG